MSCVIKKVDKYRILINHHKDSRIVPIAPSPGSATGLNRLFETRMNESFEQTDSNDHPMTRNTHSYYLLKQIFVRTSETNEQPVPVLYHRTEKTKMGLLNDLVAILRSRSIRSHFSKLPVRS